MARSFLWGGDLDHLAIPKLSWDTCCTPKEEGGLGILNLTYLSTRMVGKWILRSIDCEDYWALLVKRKVSSFPLLVYKAWSNLSLRDIIVSPMKFKPSGTKLISRLWEAWNHIKVGWRPPKYISSNHSFFWKIHLGLAFLQ
ncbi:hypothetical protein GOP47_0023103 [Adiantum capillus-veneris]|uniref:Uncharacterized protein n=1 Tax=Adiantum capillus-veneris TaxID=13818 RepID=A0A9D4U8M1_ADICA|nr:hypothetical protein GOP47_0023103 [Adiantum capillus-veneris]